MSSSLLLLSLACVIGHGLAGFYGVQNHHTHLYSDDYVTNPNRVIVHGTRDMMPFQVYIRVVRNRRTYRCGGSIIHAQYVLTAAHCTKHMELGQTTVFAGLEDLEKMSAEGVQSREVVRISKHEGFDENTRIHDIAVLKLSRPFNLTSSVQPVKIYRRDYFVSKFLKTIGFGHVSETPLERTQLSRISMNFVHLGVCGDRFNGTIRLKQTQMCARIPAIGVGMSFLGAPLVHLEADLRTLHQETFFTKDSVYEWRQVGILSYYKYGGTSDNIFVATRLSMYCGFISKRSDFKVACE
uniref:Peptidase S1 domain-containing protein n=1 Tax=Steinernema glaseri TaxID=37863 RepID=A0A1I7Y2V6_9BILA